MKARTSVPWQAPDADPSLSTACLAIVALLGGGLLMTIGHTTPGMLLVYFGAQASFNMYMKIVLSNAQVSETLGMWGFPATFLVTALQQLITLVVCLVLLAILWVSPWKYRPRLLKTRAEWAAMLCYSLAFALNHALNFLSLSLLAVSVNLVIRSCLPLVAVILQAALGSCFSGMAARAGLQASHREISLMLVGVLFAVLATLAQANGTTDEVSARLGLGVATEVLSVFFAAVNLVCAGILGSGMDFSPLDATLYSALPSALCLLPPVFQMRHPTWPGQDAMTDWEVLFRVWELSPSTVWLVALSGVFSALYSLLIFSVVRALSASHAAFASNVNRGLTVVCAVLFGLEQLPRGVWSVVMILAVVGNIGAFAFYSYVKVRARAAKKGAPEDLLDKKLAEPKTGEQSEAAFSALQGKAAQQ